MTIKVLADRVISQIAAGEVVERPASVVKELVENALDAGSTQITVEIQGGGIGLVRVTDNGSGIADAEVELAFQRHATSKIGDIADLQSLTTLGFRGEALPSLAAVAQVEVTTSLEGDSGSYLNLSGGRIVRHETRARPPGTTVSVANLFRSLPARLKFLKSANAEAGRCADVVSHYALAYPEVRFTFINDGKTILRTPGSGYLRDSVAAVYGLAVAQDMLAVNNHNATGSGDAPPIRVSGLTSAPGLTRASRDYLSFFVNRRWISNRLLAFAVEEAYHGLLMQGKHPITVIQIEIDPALIDVNVHPAKTEIKFQDERAVFSAVQKAVRAALVQSAPVPRVEEIRSDFTIPAASLSTPPKSPIRPFIPAAPAAVVLPASSGTPPLISLPLLRVLGQLARTYIVAEGPDGLFLIDQHAAHERIMLEKIRREHSARQVEAQGLLEAITVEVEPPQAALLSEHLADLAGFGFTIEPFGERTFLVRAIPTVLAERDWQSLLKESLETRAADWSENLLNILACHSAIRAGQVLNETEMRALVKQLEQTALPNSCPHGRPTMIQITLQRLEKEFGRS
jgi:DNA mismatch repair protein MutL